MNRTADTIIKICLLSVMIPCAASSIYAQATRVAQGISGVVEDQSGALIPDATVVARNIDTGVETSTVTNPSGYFSLPGLPIGTYNLTASAKGFKTVVRENVNVLVGLTPNVEINLAVGAATQAVTVTGTVVTLDTTSTTLGTSRSGQDFHSANPGGNIHWQSGPRLSSSILRRGQSH
jgi:hypothetical protein